MEKYIRNGKMYPLLLLVILTQRGSHAMHTSTGCYNSVPTAYLDTPPSAGSSQLIKQLLYSGTKLVKDFAEYEIDTKIAFKASMTMLALWSAPLLYNIALCKWKQQKVKRKIGASPTIENITAFHTNRVNSEPLAIAQALKDVRLDCGGGHMAKELINIIDTYDEDRIPRTQNHIQSLVDHDISQSTYQPLVLYNQPILHPLPVIYQPRETALNKLAKVCSRGALLVDLKSLLYDYGKHTIKKKSLLYFPLVDPKFTINAGVFTFSALSYSHLQESMRKAFHELFGETEGFYKEQYLDIGAHLLLTTFLLLKKMAIEELTTTFIKPIK